jgi:hypothetical protein
MTGCCPFVLRCKGLLLVAYVGAAALQLEGTAHRGLPWQRKSAVRRSEGAGPWGQNWAENHILPSQASAAYSSHV